MDRLHKVATGFGGALKAPVGLVADLATAPWNDDDEFDGFINTIYRRTVKRGGEFFGELVGPDEGLGAAIGALPGTVRRPAAAVIDPAMRGAEYAYREGVSRPVATTYIAGNMAAEGKFGEGFQRAASPLLGVNSIVSALFGDADLVEAYRMSENMSPGQAAAAAVFNANIYNEAELARISATDRYEILSGVVDATYRLTADPSVVAGKAATTARIRYLTQPIRSAEDINRAMESGRVGRFVDALQGKSAAEIRDQFFPDHKNGAVIASVLDDALQMDSGAKVAVTAPAYTDVERAVLEMSGPLGTGVTKKIAQPFLGGESHGVEPVLIKNGIPLASLIDDAGNATDHYLEFGDDIKKVLKDERVRVEADPETTFKANTLRGIDEMLAGIEKLDTRMQGVNLTAGIASGQNVAMALRAMMGDADAIEAIRAQRAALAGKIDRLTSDLSDLDADDSLFGDPQRAANLQAEIDELYPLDQRLARAEAATATMTEVPRVSRVGELRTAITRSDFYQESPLAAPVRVVFNMNPQGMVRLHDQSGDIQLDRQLRKSGMDRATRDGLRGEYMAALNPMERQQVLAKAENVAVEALAGKAGMTTDEINAALSEAARGRAQAAQVMQSRIYDGAGRSRVMIPPETPGGAWTEMHVPMMATQEANVMPLVDMDELRKVTTSIGRFRSAHPATDIPAELVTKFYKLWKPSVLLRVGWPLRVVGDEQLRIIAKLGALSQFNEIKGNVAQSLGQTLKRIPNEERVGPYNRVFRVGNYELEGPFGAPGDAANISRQLASSRSSFEASIGQTERGVLNTLRESTGEWRHITPDAPDYGPAWEKDVNLQIGQDEMARRLLQGDTPEQVAKWMRSTPEGRAYAARNPIRSRNVDRWVNTVAEHVESYLPTDELKELALRRKATAADLSRAIPDAAARPIVHGEILSQALGKSTVDKVLGGIIEGGYKFLGSAPSDFLSRNPFFSQMYKAEASRLTRLLDEQRPGMLAAEDLRMVEARSRDYALAETKNLLYDLAEGSELGELARFFMPFYGAWQEVITRWAGLAIENPAFVARTRLVAGAPEKARFDWFSVTDEEGNVITDDSPNRDTHDRFLTIRIPEFVKDLPGGRGLRSQGSVKFSKDSFNMVLQGPPGFGPPVQIPLNEIVKGRPELEDSVKWALPFGTTQEVKDMLLPATAKRLRSRSQGEEDRIYTNTLARIFTTKLVDYNLGKRDDRPTYAEAKKETDSFFNMRLFASFTSPSAPSFDSPYQMYISAYRKLREADPETADEKFLDQFGEEFFPLTASFSRSKDGVPPTVEAYAARSRYRDLIEEYPDLGGLIVGSEGAGDFARSVYDAQLSTPIRPGSDIHQREGQSFEEIEAGPEVRLGWLEYRRVMSLVEAERIQRGLPNLQVKAARDLAEIKRAATQRLAVRYPKWYEGFATVDQNAMTRRIEAMQKIADDDRLAQREDIRGLGEYLRARRAVQAELASRDAHTLTAGANQDLALLWESIKGAIVERNLAFQDLYYRYLERDMVAA